MTLYKPDGMLALSIRPPWPWAIVELSEPDAKRIENREWRWLGGPSPRLPTWCAIHVSKAGDPDDWDAIEDICDRRPPPHAEHAPGCIVALATIVGAVVDVKPADPQHRWWCGGYGLLFGRVTRLSTPVEAKGALGFWRVPPTTAEIVMQMAATAARSNG